ncbi:TPM domain-containing protein [Archangium sp.]|uniref:TPM domain-containing protein n=1 Tax=Archangium sp. TaxID=1872627 RepID=UPI0038D400C4
MRRLVPFLAVLCCVLGLESSGATVSSVPKPSRGSWVVDTTRTLDAKTRAEVNQLGAEVHSSGQGQLVVVVVDTTQKVPARTFAQKLFNTWGIGKAGRDDGALLFIALEDHKAELLLGDGLTTPEAASGGRAASGAGRAGAGRVRAGERPWHPDLGAPRRGGVRVGMGAAGEAGHAQGPAPGGPRGRRAERRAWRAQRRSR